MNFDEIIFLDGAMGTMLQARGMKPGENPCVFGADHPDILEHIHRGYFEAGSRIVLSNTFGASVPKMKGSGRSCEEVTSSAVSAAKRVADEFGGLVALDVGPLGELLEPLGSLPFEDAVGFFKTQMTAGANAGADLIFIETMMDLYEAKAALLAAKEATSLPVFVTMTFEENGRTFTGCDVPSAAVCLSSLGADAIGVNCSVGPDKLVSVISEMRKYTTLPIIAKPNAGIPRADGSYDLTAEEFAEHTARLVKAGACVVGGCCGTTPEHIRLLKEKLRGVKSPERPEKVPVGVCSSTRHILLSRPVTVGERLNPTGKKLLKQALTDGDMGYICRQAVAQQEQGAEILDINVGIPGANEEELMKKVVAAVRSVSDLPLQIDSSDPAAIEAGLRLAGGRSIVNSVNGKEESLTAVLPIVKKYGAVVVGLTLDENGIPETSEGRVSIAKKIIARCEAAGIPRENIAVDCLTMTVGVDPENPKITLDALSEVKKLGAKTVLGVSNVSFGLPRRDIVNRTFLAAALNRGLDLAIINPGDEAMIETMFASRLLNGFDAGGAEYIEKFAQSVPEK
ncbi:MAG: homocysteine S-methyltransferase family protein, partial [Eubacteriales bacterium]|nr:homocysteine S-methyltransferase family protein [Eubacteriales bacterium]